MNHEISALKELTGIDHTILKMVEIVGHNFTDQLI